MSSSIHVRNLVRGTEREARNDFGVRAGLSLSLSLLL